MQQLVEPNELHQLPLAGWLAGYPAAQLHPPPGLARKRRELPWQAQLDDAAPAAWAGEIDPLVFRGSPLLEEVFFFHCASRTLLVGDLIQRFEAGSVPGWRGLLMRLDGLVGPGGGAPREWRVSCWNRRRARVPGPRARLRPRADGDRPRRAARRERPHRAGPRLPLAALKRRPAGGRADEGLTRQGFWHIVCQNKPEVAPVQIALYPTSEQIQALLSDPSDGPVVMLNLLHFKPGGEAAYRRYATAMRKIVEGRGGRFVWSGRVTAQVLGSGGEGFQAVGLVEYPSRKAFVEIATSKEVAEIGVHRAEGLEGQWLLATTAQPFA